MNNNELYNYIEDDGLAKLFTDLYFDKASLQKARYLNAIKAFEKNFGAQDIAIYSAPGRTEIGGNHTDHQHGEVLAASINQDAIAVVAATEDQRISLVSGDAPMFTVDCNDSDVKENEKNTTQSLIRGVVAGLKKNGYRVGGFQAYVTSDVLIGAGLSSSAAFETLLGTILSGLYNDGTVSAIEIAKIGQYAENVYFGKPCGLMDQMACSVGSLVHIDFADPSSPVVEKVEYDFSKKGYHLCITDTKGSHADLTPDYAAVPAEMKSVATYFGKEVLHEVSEEDVVKNITALREKCGDRAVLRALHFYEENKRVQKQTKALKADEIDTFLKTVAASGASSFQFLQNVYTNHDITHQNVSVSLQLAEMILQGRGAARVHGGGFAGTMQAWVPDDLVEAYAAQMDAVFGKGACSVLAIRGCGGIRVI